MYIPTTVLTSGGTASITSVDYTLSGDVTMTNADQFYDGPSGSFDAGTWLLIWRLAIVAAANLSQAIAAKLWDGSTVYDENEYEFGQLAGVGAFMPLSGVAVVTLGSTTTLKVSAVSVRASNVISRDTAFHTASSHTASRLSGIQIA